MIIMIIFVIKFVVVFSSSSSSSSSSSISSGTFIDFQVYIVSTSGPVVQNLDRSQ